MAGSALLTQCVVGVDIKQYSVGRNIRQQDALQRVLDAKLSMSAESVGLDRGSWDRHPGGDGEMAVIPPECDLSAVVGGFVRHLDDGLAAHNEDHGASMQIKLRMAIHIGLLKRSELGYAGPALIVLSRLLNAHQLRAALRDPRNGDLALLVSSPVYEVVEAGVDGLRPRAFQQVHVEDPAKGFGQIAYLHVAGGPTGPAVQGEPRAANPAARKETDDTAPAPGRDTDSGTGTGTGTGTGGTTMIGTQWNLPGPGNHIKQSNGDMYIFNTSTDDT
ncbi:hypothetical protein [Streptosporangium sp. V21-05]|uniref:hypothetical protein n=1 Tax=Streptosporangium sp. V21-05 TaxID=3446115 RepID=UPI003F53D0EB